MSARPRSLQRRLLSLLLQWAVLATIAMSLVVTLAFRALRVDAEQQRQSLARAVAVAIDADLSEAVLRLARLSGRLPEDEESLRRTLREFRVHDRFRHAIVLVDDGGTGATTLLAVEPADRAAEIEHVLRSSDPAHPVRLERRPGGVPLIVIEHAFGSGRQRRRLLATVDARRSMLGDSLRAMIESGERHAAIVDSRGLVVASTHAKHVGLPMSQAPRIAAAIDVEGPTVWSAADSPICADDPQPLLSILVPLRHASWGLLVQEHESVAYAGAGRLRGVFVLVGGGLAAITALLALTLSRSIIAPIESLSRRAVRMSDGDLETPVESPGRDQELARLTGSLDTMRRRLGGALDELASLNRGLESKVAERTRQLSERDAERHRLVRRLLNAGEEERRRIARELHDETSQLLTAIQLALDRVDDRSPALGQARTLLIDTQREIHHVIHDLRPTLLDDLGLAAAIRSHAEARLSASGHDVQLAIDDPPPRDAVIDTALYRVFQELVTNIRRHADAGRVTVELYTEGDRLRLDVEDDGVGFDVDARRDGVGITGMRERIGLIGGTILIDSEPGMGTHVVVEVPLER